MNIFRIRFRELTDKENCWRKPADLLRLIADAIDVQLSDASATPFFSYGAAEPGPEMRDRPWLQLAEDGSPIGWFVYFEGSWVAVPAPDPPA